MTVSFSCRCPNADYLGFEASPDGIVRTAMKAEELGFDAIFVNDHIIVDGSSRSAAWTNTYDPFVALSFMAANTSRIGLGISVLIVPYRNPIATAKTLATLDRMSGGRLVCGVGVGWNEAEFAALGVEFHERGARTNEYLRLWQACWVPGEVTFEGRFFSFADMHVSPKPLRQPHPPLWVGGASAAALRRAALFAETWQPTPMALPDLLAGQTALQQACERIGRAKPPTTRMSFRVELSSITGNAPPTGSERSLGWGTPAQVVDDLRRYRDAAGLAAFQINIHGNRDLAQLIDQMDCFVQEVRPHVV
ncbi:MAG TPA: TIGR03619 family F420-dependent LLM class oxidoreductase [Acetobacteraceae bacterium]|nr:TIGR03619 family F420-dependent LLM class oxidoreductase [Acetobacteraceae bacterium]